MSLKKVASVKRMMAGRCPAASLDKLGQRFAQAMCFRNCGLHMLWPEGAKTPSSPCARRPVTTSHLEFQSLDSLDDSFAPPGVLSEHCCASPSTQVSSSESSTKASSGSTPSVQTPRSLTPSVSAVSYFSDSESRCGKRRIAPPPLQ
eukprot:gnl/TRDRNA2_/TRDRNA2_181308_c0_seq1.p1 gnl/TRDRNA2_/TRDRNA2_181308_c0~~gnl/TRDRNA2_/TRDRNA2_181308_c0_seq1.p1  ORF type:complete len:147 (+),score=15.93 gnl/TRDRNA2_/TRDRNA2_181308_c0_seq1:179-619(+)